MGRSCFLFGHGDSPQSVLSGIEAAVERHFWELGVSQFYVGGYGMFDRLAVWNMAER